MQVNICKKSKNQVLVQKQIVKNYSEDEFGLIDIQLKWELNNGVKPREIYNNLRAKNYGWNWPHYKKPELDINAIIVPGALTCSRCGSNRIMNRTKQTRSGDEGQTVFAKCVECQFMWSMS